jgi:beta-N-acetylhexosaminidase
MDGQRAIARRLVIGIPDEGLTTAWERDVSMVAPAGFIVFRRHFRDLADLRRLTIRLRELTRPRRVFIALDEEGGFVSQLAGHLTVPPNATLLARGAAPGDIEYVARVTGERLRALGFDWDFAPVADVHSQLDNPVIGPRAFGATPEAVSAAVGEWLAGFRAAGIASCLKHFPGHGDTTLDSHLTLPRFDGDLALLERRELAPYRAHPDADSVMTAHVVYPALDAGNPGSLSRAVTHGLLRERLGFGGLAITDALEMRGAAEGRGPGELARMALEAGNDLLLYAFHDDAVRRVRLELAKALVDGGLDHAAFDEARPRLAAFDRAHPEPAEAELGRALETLTPPEWESRLTAIIERGLIVRGALPRAAAEGAWRVSEPEFAHGSSLRESLGALGIAVDAGASPAAEMVAVMSRLPLPEAEIERLRALARERPLILVGLQNDAFLSRAPEAALTISASDATPLTRAAVTRRLAAARAAAGAV